MTASANKEFIFTFIIIFFYFNKILPKTCKISDMKKIHMKNTKELFFV
jgi:hypothetical protein